MPFRDCATDEEQLTCFFQHAALPLYKYALHLTRSVSLAEDAVQATFTQLVQYYDRVRGFDEGRLLAYAKKVLAHQCGLLIKRQNMVVLLEEVSPRAAPQEPVVDFVERQATRAELLHCIERLKPRYRRILHMKYFENLSSEQIGRELGLPANQARVLLTRARGELKRIYQQEILREDGAKEGRSHE